MPSVVYFHWNGVVFCCFACATVTLTRSNMAALAAALQQLSRFSSGSLVHLNVCVLPDAELIQTLLDAAPSSVATLYVEVQTVSQDQRCPPPPTVPRCDAAGEQSAD